MNNGYPATAAITAMLATLGIEEITDNNTDFREEFLQLIYAMIQPVRWAMVLGVWLPSATTFNVIGGYYLYDGAEKEYVPGAAIDPTDNDTTYIWLKPDNSVGHGIDGNGWPVTEHVKLAEIDVDTDGVITAVRDLRGKTFMSFTPAS